jgi:Flp pilus assembly protein protease CpaA
MMSIGTAALAGRRTMAPNLLYSEIVLVVTAAVLLYAAFNDLKHYKIRNELIVVLVLLYCAYALFSGLWITAHWHFAFAFLMFIVMCFFYSRGLMGGGDLKLLTAAFLWVGLDCALAFAVLLLGFSTAHLIAARLGFAQTRQSDQDKNGRIPLAPSVAAALIAIFMLGCLAPRAGDLLNG